VSTYGYAAGAPTIFFDPDGLLLRPLPPGLGPLLRPTPVRPNPVRPAPPSVPRPVPPVLPDDRPWRDGPKRWKVYVRCNVTAFGHDGHGDDGWAGSSSSNSGLCGKCPPPETIGGWGYGGTFGQASANAQHDANANLGALGKTGCYPRHCQAVACFVTARRVTCPKSGR